MKKLLSILGMLFLLTAIGFPVKAEETAKPVVALGADLSAEQRATVLNLMGLTEEQLSECTVITITNAQEHEYLDAYVDSSVIGTKSLSSVMLTKASSGNGVLVTTKNINYCTTGMYRNALLTAGLEDTDVLVVGPFDISGTAALIGAVKAYEAMTGVTVSDTTIDTAMNELVTTGDIAANTENSEEVEQLIAYIKAKMADGELENEDDIRAAIKEGQEKFGVTLTDEEITQIVEVMDKIRTLGLDPEVLLNQAQDLYQKFGDDIVNHTKDIIKESVTTSISNFFKDLGTNVKNFFTGLFSKN
jgi:uncharacterized protein YpuA (DUF1002 family)